MRAACPSCSTRVDTDPGELAACSACGHWWIAEEPADGDGGDACVGGGSGSETSLSGPLDAATDDLPAVPDGDPSGQPDLDSDAVSELDPAQSDGPSLHPAQGAADAPPGGPAVLSPDLASDGPSGAPSPAPLPAGAMGVGGGISASAPSPVPRPSEPEWHEDPLSFLPVPEMVPPDEPWEFEVQLAVGDRVQGPFDRMLLQEQLYTGLLTGDERIRVPGSSVWRRLGDREEFAKVLQLLGKDEDVPGQRRIASWQRSSVAATESAPAAPGAGASPVNSARAAGSGASKVGAASAPPASTSAPRSADAVPPAPAPAPAGGKMALVAGVVVVVIGLIALAAYLVGS